VCAVWAETSENHTAPLVSCGCCGCACGSRNDASLPQH